MSACVYNIDKRGLHGDTDRYVSDTGGVSSGTYIGTVFEEKN